MSEHVADSLPLAGAGALDPEEAARVAAHLRECAPCAARAAEWRDIGEALRGLPRPRLSPALLARTRHAVEWRLAQRADQALNRTVFAFLLAVSWALVAVAWFLLDLLGRELMLRLSRPLGSTALWFGAYVVAGWAMAGAATVLLGRRARDEGRTV